MFSSFTRLDFPLVLASALLSLSVLAAKPAMAQDTTADEPASSDTSPSPPTAPEAAPADDDFFGWLGEILETNPQAGQQGNNRPRIGNDRDRDHGGGGGGGGGGSH